MEVDFLDSLLECVGPVKVPVLGVGVCLWLCVGLGDEHACLCLCEPEVSLGPCSSAGATDLVFGKRCPC